MIHSFSRTGQNPTKSAAQHEGLPEVATDSAYSPVHLSIQQLFRQNHRLPVLAESWIFDLIQAYYRHRPHRGWFLRENPLQHPLSRRVTYRWKTSGPLPYPTRVGIGLALVPNEKATELKALLARCAVCVCGPIFRTSFFFLRNHGWLVQQCFRIYDKTADS